MFPDIEARASDSPFVERIWRSNSEQADSFTAISTVCWSMVVSKYTGQIQISLHGPKTGAIDMASLAELEWFGIDFKLGVFMPQLPPSSVMDGAITLPDAADHAFWLGSSAWQFPNYENADAFVDQLVHAGILVYEPIMNIAHQEQSPTLSLRMIQYRVLRATGLSQRTIRQIERARYAAALLKRGVSIFDTVCEAGYSDQSHLTRSLKHFIGLTPSEVLTTPIIAL